MFASNSRNYTDTFVPLLVESVLIGILVNLVSDYVASWLQAKDWLQMDGTSVSLLLFLLLAVIALYAFFQRRIGNPEYPDPQRPTEFGSMLSLVFFAQLLFLDCSKLAEFNRWLLIGAGSAPFLVGTGMTGYLHSKYHEYQDRKYKSEEKKRAEWAVEAERQAQRMAGMQSSKPSVPTAAENPYDDDLKRASRINMRAAIQGDLDVERQPGVLLIIIESILSVKKTVTQMEIFEVCKSLAKKIPVDNLLELIRDLMGSFVNLRQNIRGVNLNTEDKTNWQITENISYWKKNS
jgi:hypothetical protein